jgi:MFS family permease
MGGRQEEGHGRGSGAPAQPAGLPAEQEQRRRWYQGATRGQWLALAAALLGWMFDGFEMGIFPQVARPCLIELLDLGPHARRARDETLGPQVRQAASAAVDSQVGLWNSWITAAFLLGAAVGGWLFGWLGDRVGRVRAMVFSVLTYAVFTGLCGLATGPYQLAGLRFLGALGMGGEWALGVALVMECWAPRARPMLAGLIGASANVGFIVAARLVRVMGQVVVPLEEGGWRVVLGICALPAVLTFFLRMFVPESERWQQAVHSGPRPRLTEIFTPALWRHTVMGAVLSGVALIGTWASVQWIPPWVQKLTPDRVRAQELASAAQEYGGLGAVLGCLLAALIGQYVGRRVAYFTLCLGSLVICACLFRWLPPVVDSLFLLTVFGTGMLTASFYGWLPLYLPELFPTRVRATGQGFGYNAGRVIAAAGVLGTGYLMSGDLAPGDYARAGATITLVYVVGMVVVWLAPETHGQPLPE